MLAQTSRIHTKGQPACAWSLKDMVGELAEREGPEQDELGVGVRMRARREVKHRARGLGWPLCIMRSP